MAGPPDSYELNKIEQRRFDELAEEMQSYGGLFETDSDGMLVNDDNSQPIRVAFKTLPGKKFAIGKDGKCWRYGADKAQKGEGVTGAPFRHNSVEIWTGHWRKVTVTENGKSLVRYAKRLIWVPVSKGVNEKLGFDAIDFYLTRKGFKHPFDAPHVPTAAAIKKLEDKEEEARFNIFAKAAELAESAGSKEEAAALQKILAAEGSKKPKKGKKSTKRSNKDGA